MTRKLLPAIATLGLASTLLLSGCSLLPHAPSLGGGNSSSDGGGSSDDGQMHAVLPDTFPSDVPLVGDDFAYAIQVSDKAWGVNVRVEDADKGFEKAAQQLNDAGIAQNTDIGGSSDGVTIGSFQGNGYTVQLNAYSDSEFGPVVQYAVVKAD